MNIYRKNILRISLFFIFILIKASIVFSQYPAWQNYANCNKVTDILSTSNTLWITTYGGLIKFDKTTEVETLYNRANAGLPDNHLRSLAIDKSGNIWITSQYYGIGMFDGVKCHGFNSSNSNLPSDQWNSTIAIDSDDNIWIGSLRWLVRFDGNRWNNWETGSVTSPYSSINDLLIDRTGNLWLAASWGFGKFSGNDIQIYSDISREAYCIEIDKGNNLWIGTNEQGLIKYDRNSFQVYNTSNSEIPGNIIYDIKSDSQGNIWCACGSKLVKFDGKAFYSYSDTLFYGGISSIEIDENNDIWIGTLLNGLVKISGNVYKQIKLSSSILPSNKITDFSIDVNNNIWIGTEYSLLKTNGQNWLEYYKSIKYYDSKDRITALKNDTLGNLWVALGRSDTCLLFINPDDTFIFNSLNSPLNNEIDINTIELDKKGNVWLATNRGLFQYTKSSWQIFDTSNSSLTSNKVTHIAIDKLDNLWGGTSTSRYYDYNLGIFITKPGCLFKYDGSNWTIYNKSNSGLPYNSIGTLSFDSNNVLWLNTRDDRNVGREFGGGLTKFDGTTWVSYNIYNSSLPGNTIWDIYVDSNDNVWSGTCGQGLVSFDRNNGWKVYNVYNSGIAFNDVSKIAEDIKGNLWLGHGALIEGGISIADLNIINNDNTSFNNADCFHVFPNPSHNIVTIFFKNNSAGDYLLNISDLSGRLLFSKYMKPSINQKIFEYSLSELNIDKNGVYFISLIFSDCISSRKFIVIK